MCLIPFQAFLTAVHHIHMTQILHTDFDNVAASFSATRSADVASLLMTATICCPVCLLTLLENVTPSSFCIGPGVCAQDLLAITGRSSLCCIVTQYIDFAS